MGNANKTRPETGRVDRREGFRYEVGGVGNFGGNYLGMYQKEHPTGSLPQTVLGWPGGRVAGWPGGRVAGWPGGRVAGWPGGRAMSVCIAEGGGWLCVPASPPESSASISNRPRSSAACVGAKIKERGRAWGSRYGVGWLVHPRGQPMPNGFDSDSDRTPGVTTGSTANGSLERSGAMGLPDGKG